VYRIALALVGGPPGCPCFGYLSNNSILLTHALNAILFVAFAFLLLGSYSGLVFVVRNARMCRFTPSATSTRALFLLAITGSVVAIPGSAMAEQAIRFEGVITRTNYAAGGVVADVRKAQFSVVRHDGQDQGSFQIETALFTGPDSIQEIIGCVAEDCYTLRQKWPSRAEMLKTPPPEEHGIVNAGTFPSEALAPAQVLWLCFLATAPDLTTNGPPFAFLDEAKISDLNARFTFDNRVAIGMLSNAVCFAPGKVYLPNRSGTALEAKPLPAPYHQGYRIWDYTSSRFASEHGRSYPMLAFLRRYFPKGGGAKDNNDLELVMVMAVLVTNVQSVSKAVFTLPQPSRTILPVIDFRNPEMAPPPNMPSLAKVGMRYNITNGAWQLRGGQFLRGELAYMSAFKARLERERRMQPVARAITAVALVAALAFPFVVTFRRRK
jgi:hypothetical protein